MNRRRAWVPPRLTVDCDTLFANPLIALGQGVFVFRNFLMSFPPSHPALDAALAARGYEQPTEVQLAVLNPELAGRDLLVSAQTGSGKTVAFGLASADTLLGDADRFVTAAAPLALIIAPTRELAMQVNTELSWLYANAGGRIVSCVGGTDARREARALSFGTHIVVGTPGRLRDHIERGNLDLSAVRVVVLDEADEMLDMGFKEDLEFILQTTPEGRRTLLFSATIARDIAQLAKTYQRDAARIDTTRKDTPHGDIEYRAIRIAPTDMEHAVVNVLRYVEAPGAIVFCNTREAVKHLQASLKERGFSVVGLSGELSQRERSDALQALRDGHARVCVATDVAARGLDLPDLGLVIHAQLPINKAGLLHRSGRTGRAGKKGTSVLLVSYTRRRKIEQMLASANIEATWSGPPSAEEIRAKDRDRLLEALSTDHEYTDNELVLAHQLLARRSPEQLAAALIRQARTGMPTPEEVFDDERMKKAQESQPKAEFVDFARDSDCEWFRLNLGRDKNADPKWILPLICRLGHVTKRDIGSIKIFDRETKFEITRSALERFEQAIKTPGEDGVTIEPTTAPAARDRTAPPRPKPGGPRREDARPARARRDDDRPYRGRPDGDDRPARFEDRKPRGDKPFKEKPYRDKSGRDSETPRPAKAPRHDAPWSPAIDSGAPVSADEASRVWAKRGKLPPPDRAPDRAPAHQKTTSRIERTTNGENPGRAKPKKDRPAKAKAKTRSNKDKGKPKPKVR